MICVWQCYGMYIDQVREVVTSPLQEAHIGHVLVQLQSVFAALDQHYTNAPERPKAPMSKEPSSMLCPGQTLKEVEGRISADPTWSPEYFVATDQ